MKLSAGQFYGDTAGTFATGGFSFTERTYTPDAALPPHAHELSHFCFVLNGYYSEKIGGRNFEREPTALVYYPPDTSHAEKHFSKGRHFLIEIDGEGLERVTDYGARLDDLLVLPGESSLQTAMRMYGEFRQRDVFSSLALESTTTELLVNASRERVKPEKTEPRWLGQIKEYLNENFTQPPGLSDLAEAAGVHPTHVARVFRKFEKCTAGEYVRRIRIRRARREMLTSDKTLVEIALETGFSDQSHFTRTFKRATGMTPNAFRKAFR